LPDGLFPNQKNNLGKFWGELQWKRFLYFIEPLIYLTAVWYISQPFVTFCGNLVYFPRFGMLCQEKSGKPVAQGRKTAVTV
jgi:hypothetical protein